VVVVVVVAVVVAPVPVPVAGWVASPRACGAATSLVEACHLDAPPAAARCSAATEGVFTNRQDRNDPVPSLLQPAVLC
jgi:hypothetical protein